LKVAYWDVESTDLAGDFGRLLSASVLTHTGEMVSLRQDDFVKAGLAADMSDDHAIAVALRDLLEEHNLHVAFFGKGFDVPFLNTRLIANGERFLRQMLMIDPRWYYSGWRGVKTSNAKLKTVSSFFGYEPKQEVTAETWVKARVGNRDAMDIVVERCESDVRILKEITERTINLYP
jgi:uncharacterized protein YprB with RNaseH-like and TPR domain